MGIFILFGDITHFISVQKKNAYLDYYVLFTSGWSVPGWHHYTGPPSHIFTHNKYAFYLSLADNQSDNERDGRPDTGASQTQQTFNAINNANFQGTSTNIIWLVSWRDTDIVLTVSACLFSDLPRPWLETIMTVVVVAKTCTGLPTINGVMENITANLGDKVGHILISSLYLLFYICQA